MLMASDALAYSSETSARSASGNGFARMLMFSGRSLETASGGRVGRKVA